MMRRVIMLAMLTATVCAQTDDEWATAIGQTTQVTKGLVAYWAMRNSGTTVFDEYGSYNGTTVNSPTFAYTNGVVGNGVRLVQSSSQYITIPDNNAFSFGNGTTDSPFSISAWIYMVDATGFRIVTKFPSGTSNREYMFDTRGENDKLRLYLFDNSANTDLAARYDTAMTARENTWLHVVATYSGSSLWTGIALYVDGTAVATVNDTYGPGYIAMENGTAAVEIGRTVSAAYANGMVDEVCLYNRVLTASEIKQLYRMGALPRGIK